MAVDRHRRKPLLGNVYGGLSGPALKPVALRVVYEVAQVVDIPIVAIGGVSELDDVLDFLMVGACAVQVGTAVFADPVLPLRLIDELEAWCAAHGMSSHQELIGRRTADSPRATQRQGRRVPTIVAARSRAAAGSRAARAGQHRPAATVRACR